MINIPLLTKCKNPTRLELQDGSIYHGQAFGYPGSVAGEVVFNTGMVGYPETLTDPSYKGQILVLTYPLIGNYGVPEIHYEGGLVRHFESEFVQISGLVITDLSLSHNHWSASSDLDLWLKKFEVPGIMGVDTRAITKKLRNKGSMLGRIAFNGPLPEYYDPNGTNLVAQVSISEPIVYENGPKRVILIDCGCKNNIIRSLTQRNLTVIRVPWDYDFLDEKFDGVVISNGPGDPKQCKPTALNIEHVLERDIPTFGICLGNQILALAAGAETYKLKFGHRSQNQPVILNGSKRCFITSQNHGYAVMDEKLPQGWQTWLSNANDNTNEGVRHNSKPFFSVQFHPEASPGPVDTEFIFDEFLRLL
jgi:carbamoyl-phosphate synthase small subunit